MNKKNDINVEPHVQFNTQPEIINEIPKSVIHLSHTSTPKRNKHISFDDSDIHTNNSFSNDVYYLERKPRYVKPKNIPGLEGEYDNYDEILPEQKHYNKSQQDENISNHIKTGYELNNDNNYKILDVEYEEYDPIEYSKFYPKNLPRTIDLSYIDKIPAAGIKTIPSESVKEVLNEYD